MIRHRTRATSRMAITVARRPARIAIQGATPMHRVMAAIAATGIDVAVEHASFLPREPRFGLRNTQTGMTMG